MRVINSIVLATLLVALLSACTESKSSSSSLAEVNNTNNNNNSNNSNGGGGGSFPSPTPTPTPTSGTPKSNYYRISNIVVHGTNPKSIHSPVSADQIVWNSEHHLPNGTPPDVLATDYRFDVRVKALSAPGQGTNSTRKRCANRPLAYTRLHIGVAVGKISGGSFAETDYYQFKNVMVDSFSGVYSFRVPPALTGSLTMVVKEVKWDYSCIFSGGSSQTYCGPELDYVWEDECVRFNIEYATDYTEDLPGYPVQ